MTEWKVLWPWVKKGNLSARTTLLSLIVPIGSGGGQMYLPGSAHDELSLHRDGLILALHSIGISPDDPLYDTHGRISEFLFASTLDNSIKWNAFKACLKKYPDKRVPCVTGAVAVHLIPAFEQFAAQIDMNIRNGKKPVCTFHYPHKRK